MSAVTQRVVGLFVGLFQAILVKIYQYIVDPAPPNSLPNRVFTSLATGPLRYTPSLPNLTSCKQPLDMVRIKIVMLQWKASISDTFSAFQVARIQIAVPRRCGQDRRCLVMTVRK